MTIPKTNAQLMAAKNTGCGSNGRKVWVDVVTPVEHTALARAARRRDVLGEGANSTGPGFFVTRYGQQCGSDDQSFGFLQGPFECAKAVDEAGGRFFTFHSNGDCRLEKTVIGECPEGWVSADADFYQILQTPKDRPSQCKRRYTGHIVPDANQPSTYFPQNQSQVIVSDLSHL